MGRPEQGCLSATPDARSPARVAVSRRQHLAATRLCAVACLAPAFASAQGVAAVTSGTVRDSASGRPVAGAVVLVLDARDSTIARSLTDVHGRYRAPRLPSARRVVLRHLGFRPRTLSLSPSGDAVDVALARLPTLLEPATVHDDARCPRRADGAVALGLWEQARAALLATVVARETAPATWIRLRFDRTLDGERITRQLVLADSSPPTAVPFGAARTGPELARQGFVERQRDGRLTFFAPDAEALLDESFARAYCFHIVAADRERVGEVGLALAPAERRQERVDIDGVLWIDTVHRELRQLVFDYVSGDRALAEPRRSGRLDFMTLANGALLDRWTLRIPRLHAGRREWYEPHELGGEVARARWPDGYEWRAPLGALRLHTRMAGGTPARGATIRLRDTSLEATTDSTGAATIPSLLAGPYAADVVDTALARIDVALPTALRFDVARDTVVDATLAVPTRDDFVALGCRDAGQQPDAPREGPAWLVGRIVASPGESADGVHWRIRQQVGAAWREVEGGRTGADGLIFQCVGVARGRPTEVRAWRAGEEGQSVRVRVVPVDLVTVVRVELGLR